MCKDFVLKIVAYLSCSAGRTHFARTKIIHDNTFLFVSYTIKFKQTRLPGVVPQPVIFNFIVLDLGCIHFKFSSLKADRRLLMNFLSICE